ncbi:MAG: EcoKI restriction-modification system protein HsdS [Bacteroidetes bacterium ADurb.BinA261]|jgi:type I restriction enzyme S subunit|nr:MAG: EcoKI restriction-modification system protein HsdS [Bacteroidetes bacterium ADurb.BinA261]
MNNENKLVPKFRFKEFEGNGEWEEKALGEVFTSFSGGTPSTTQKIYYGGNIPFIRSAEINKTSTELFLTELGLKNSSAKMVSKGDLLVALYGANSGDVAISKIDGAINQAILCLKSEFSNTFIYHFLSGKKDWIVSKYIQGGQGNLSGEIVKSISVLFPTTQEQQKIAACLSSLDEVIAGESQKLELLKEHKKGLLQNLFPQDGETVPKLRFKEFVGNWKNVQLGSLIEIKGRIGYRGYTTNDIVEKGQGAITFSPSNIDDNNQLNFNKATYISWDKYFESPEIMLQDGYTVLVKTGSSFGKAVFIKNLPGKTTINPQLVVLKPININPKFLFLLVCNSAIQRQIKETVVGGAIPTLSQESISRFEILIPPDKNKKEQEKIADTLSSIDDLINSQSQKIETLKLHKKGLLQGLFPPVKEDSNG